MNFNLILASYSFSCVLNAKMFKLTYLVLLLLVTRQSLQTRTFELDLLETGSLEPDLDSVAILLKDSAIVNLKYSNVAHSAEMISVVLIRDGVRSFFIGDSSSVMNVYNQVKFVDNDSTFVSMVQLGVDSETNIFHFLVAIREQESGPSLVRLMADETNSTDANESNDQTITLDDSLGPVLFIVLLLIFYGLTVLSVMISRMNPRLRIDYNQKERKKGKLDFFFLNSSSDLC